MPKIFEGNSVSLKYKLGEVEIDALRDLDFSIESGTFTCLAGPSGSGKSTLLNLLGLIEPVQSGNLTYLGRAVVGLNENEMNKIRRFEIGFIFQSFHLIDVLTAEENVEYFLMSQGVERNRRKQLVLSALKWVGLLDQAHKKPGQMSGGQRQRVAIARALAKQPKVVLADEPTANLDTKTGENVLSMLTNICREYGCSVVMASHDPQAIAIAQNVIRLRDGRIVEG